MDTIVELKQIRKRYGEGTPVEAEVLHGIDLKISGGEFAALTGPSGSGKSTLLNIIGLLERASGGQLLIDGRDTADLDDATITTLRGRSIGFIFQFHHLLPGFTALENVMMPSIIDANWPTAKAQDQALRLLDQVGLKDAAYKRPAQLSGGMQQRVAIARALSLSPRLILADEPTGNLDSHSANDIFELLQAVNQQQHSACLIVTHDARLAARCQRQIQIEDGQLLAQTS
ncbi:MAG: ABC transporter ATP-binding protein [Gammaproteobacteria bacterium]|uniref:ABC transporter ATP-binding protein n=1 Tax=Rhodoferax sp. TaxID=50421 RepID=UPI0017CE3901|nr:ABC transporter ATP-binding protein [Rhodoferax sp.]MBU3899598.1 ABC transporter ATP-binding protein [Gammaproteobacteria bacterium]MBA3056602.1 ABC transporter ATP-binding protein [Rhodoferax sp.]MBU3998929.1 ABC transporter ATP-binding protein [Gammaproteobacteria bacterium]MBU4018074.1 ABC transporter ATP-binding protein [Gammaproteobacteria bacterium]MBU4080235.1 ABC transporter ATP-binding protein [Gammaproteobacteria bacterium]